jgi:hypothetical protein
VVLPAVLALALPVLLPVTTGLAAQDDDPRPWFVSGIVVDGRTQQPVEGAQVTLLGGELSVIATALSGVEGLWGVSGDSIAGVMQVGVVALGYLNWFSEEPVLRRGLRIELRRPGDPPPPPPIDLSDDGILDQCGDVASPDSAIVAGLIVDPDSGQGLEGVEAVADWGSPEPPRLVIGGGTEVSYRSTFSGPGGLYIFCALPPDRPMRLWIRGDAPPADSVSITLEAGRVERIELVGSREPSTR